MKSTLKQAFEAEIAVARNFIHSGNLDDAFRHLERAHVLGQRYVVPHVRSHWLMLRIALMRHSATEVWGQASRIVLGALGSAIGVVPTGNTGGTDINMFRRLPLDADVARVFEEK